MTIWRPNMLAVCISDLGRGTDETGKKPIAVPEKDHVYKVDQVIKRYGHLYLGLEEFPEIAIDAKCFRPAVQDWQSEWQSKVSWLDDFIKGRVSVP